MTDLVPDSSGHVIAVTPNRFGHMKALVPDSSRHMTGRLDKNLWATVRRQLEVMKAVHHTRPMEKKWGFTATNLLIKLKDP